MEKPISYVTSVPYIGPIYGGFSPGKMVRIQGTLPAVAYRFDINLQCGQETAPRDDVAMQVSVQLLGDYISLNSLENGFWGEEQRGTVLPIKRGGKFEIILTCDFTQYKVAINGQHYCEFPQRIHCDRITHLAVDGDISILQVFYESAALGDKISGPSAPFVPAPMEKQIFEMIDLPTTKASPSKMRSVSPSYGAAVYNNQGESAPYQINESSFPTDAPCSSGLSYPASAPATFTTGPPYSAGASYSIGAVGVVNTSPYAQSYGPVMPPPPPGQPVQVVNGPGMPPPPPGPFLTYSTRKPPTMPRWQRFLCPPPRPMRSRNQIRLLIAEEAIPPAPFLPYVPPKLGLSESEKRYVFRRRMFGIICLVVLILIMILVGLHYYGLL